MTKRRTERLLSVVVLLLGTRRYLSAWEIRDAVSGYPPQEEAFKRMFERDKEELRELGIPLEVRLPSVFDDEQGYRIRPQDYQLPEITLTAEEAAVAGIAARVWRSAQLSGAAAGAMLKLKAAGVDLDAAAGEAAGAAAAGITARLTTQEPAFGPLWEAVRDRRRVSFDYRAAGRTDAARRELEPWGVVNRRGHWYVAGHDRARGELRVFRLSRITGPVKVSGPAGAVTVPGGVDVAGLVKDFGPGAGAAPASRQALLRIRAGAGQGLRRERASVRPDPQRPGWDLVTVAFGEEEWYAEYVASFGPDVVVLGPPDLREAVIARLKGALA